MRLFLGGFFNHSACYFSKGINVLKPTFWTIANICPRRFPLSLTQYLFFGLKTIRPRKHGKVLYQIAFHRRLKLSFSPFLLLFQYEWDDQEEENYRQWIRQLQDERSTQHEIDWAELDNETAYREKLKRQTAENASMPITWEDEQEKILRERYIDMR